MKNFMYWKLKSKKVHEEVFRWGMGGVLAVAISTSALFAANSFAAKIGSTNFIEDFDSLKKAFRINEPEKFKAENIKQEIIREVDAKLTEEMGAEKFAALSADPSALQSAREQRFNADVYQGLAEKTYSSTQGSIESSKIFDGEIWRRQNELEHKILQAGRKTKVKKGDVIEYNLNEQEVPFGGYFFPDNFGGITARWNNGTMFDELNEYRTLFEDAWEDLKKSQRDKLNSLKEDKGRALAFAEKCKKLNQQKQEIMDLKIDLANLRSKVADEKKDALKLKLAEAVTKSPHIAELMELSSQVPMVTDLDEISCFLIDNYQQMKKLAETGVQKTLKEMKQKDFDELSPTEKYDIMNGFYDFRTTAFEKFYKGKRRFGNSRRAPFLSTLALTRYWEGRCNADRACGICHRKEEPTSKVNMTIDEVGKILSYEPLDAKALLMSTYFYLEDGNVITLGQRTRDVRGDNPNPAAFDIMLRTLFMSEKIPFVIDNHNDHRVNNVTIVGFKRTVKSVANIKPKQRNIIAKKVDSAMKTLEENGSILSKNYNQSAGSESWRNPRSFYEKAKQATKVMRVEVDIKLLSELKPEDANKPTKAKIAAEEAGKGHFTKKNTLVYDLFVNDEGEVLEGEYVSGDMDFLWFPAGRGNQENTEDGNHFIKYDVVSKVAKQASHGGGRMDRVTNSSIITTTGSGN